MDILSARSALLVAMALVLGLVLGGMGPRAENRALRVQLSAAEASPCDPQTLGNEMAKIFAGRPWVPPTAAPKEPRAPVVAPPPAAEEPVVVWVDDETEPQPDADFIPEGPEAIQDAMALRRTQAMAVIVEDADPDDAQLASIDAAIDDMNDSLFDIAEGFVDPIVAGIEPTRRETMEFAADTLEVLLSAEDRMRESLTDDQLDRLDPDATDALSHVDPAIVDVLMDLDPER